MSAPSAAAPSSGPPSTGRAATTPPAQRPRRRARRPLLVISLAILTAALIGSFLLGDSGPEPASVSWSPTPEALDPGSPAVQTCSAGADGAQIVDALILEQRGITALLVGTDAAGDRVTCLVVGAGEGSTSSSISSPSSVADEIAPGELISQGLLLTQADPAAEGDSDTAYQLAAAGAAGSDVVAVTLQTSAGEVEATVDNGAFAAWWPVADEAAMDEPVLAVTTLADGSTRTVELSEH